MIKSLTALICLAMLYTLALCFMAVLTGSIINGGGFPVALQADEILPAYYVAAGTACVLVVLTR